MNQSMNCIFCRINQVSGLNNVATKAFSANFTSLHELSRSCMITRVSTFCIVVKHFLC